MVDSLAPISTAGPFDTAALQIAQARAHAIASNTSEAVFLEQIAKNNDDINANALNTPPPIAPKEEFLSNALVNLDPSLDPTIDPDADPSDVPLFDIFNDPTSIPTEEALKTQQLHDMAILQKDAVLLEEAATGINPIPLGESASTVDLSPEAQGIVNGTAIAPDNGPAPLSETELSQVGSILQPVADEPLTATLLLRLQAQLAAQQNPIQLSLTTMTLAMNFIASMQTNPNHEMVNLVTPKDGAIVSPVAEIGGITIGNSTIGNTTHQS